MATEELIVRAVRAGGDRQVAHERIRQHSIEAARAMKNGATRTTCSIGSPAIRAFSVPLADLESALDATRFVGRAPQQVDEFLDAGRRAAARGRRAQPTSWPRRCAYDDHAARSRFRSSISGAARCAKSMSSTTIVCCSLRPTA